MVATCPLAVVVMFAALLGGGPAAAQDKIKVVATFSILADFVKNVGGERVTVASLVGPGGDAHVYAPSPADAKTVADARVVFVNGLGFEGWLDRLIKASGTKASVVVATRGIKTRRMETESGKGNDKGHGGDHGVTDPHAWQSVANAKIYVGNIRDALMKADPAAREIYQANADVYLAKLDALDRDIRAMIAKIPADRRKIITSHDAFGYFSAAYDMRFIAPQGVSTESEVSARDVAAIITQIKKQKIPAVFMEGITDDRLMRRIVKETGAKIGGALFSDALTDEAGAAPSYIAMMRHNIKALHDALAR